MKIHFVSPSAFEDWDYRNPDTVGIGGSETSHIEMAMRLARQGHDVTSYSPLPLDCPDVHHGGVHWKHLTDCRFDEPGTWMLYRCPQDLDKFDPSRTDQRKWLICQDEDYPQWDARFVGDVVARHRQTVVNRVVALCQAQAAQFRARHPLLAGKVCVSSNGIKGELVDRVLATADSAKRNPKRILYCSSPDRALEPLLRIFERARERDPELELVVAYGFDNCDKKLCAVERTPADKRLHDDVLWTKWILRLKERLKGPGILNVGRLPQPKLYELWTTAGLWVCCTRFRETSQIVGLEAQALGGVPIILPIWACGENVQHGVRINDVVPCTDLTNSAPVEEPLVLCRFVDEVVRLAGDPAEQERIRRVAMPWARERFHWDRYVGQWEGWMEEEAK